MKVGDLVAWSEFGEGVLGGPKEGDYCGLLLEVIPRIRRGGYGFRPARVKVLDGDCEILITRKIYVEVMT